MTERDEPAGRPEPAAPWPKERIPFALFTVAASREADRLAEATGVSVPRLMARAGARVAEAARERWPAARIAVLCGPGDNGGDGYVAAFRLRTGGRRVRVFALGAPRSPAARSAAARWRAAGGRTDPLTVESAEAAFSDARGLLTLDALFGAGLSRPLEGAALRFAMAARRTRTAVLSVDVPSGVNGDTGRVDGDSFSATATVAFERPRPGHFLGLGGERRGELIVRSIGTPEAALRSVAGRQPLWLSCPAAWPERIGRRPSDAHKYRFGHALVYSGPPGAGGAARLAALGALRAGAGLATVAATPEAVAEHAARLDAIMVRRLDTPDAWSRALSERGASAAVIGPGAGPGARDATLAAAAACEGRPDAVSLVLDADALTAFEDDPATLFRALEGRRALLTPHTGEFGRLFPDLRAELDAGPRSPVEAVAEAARRSHATVLLKGRCTIVASPQGGAWLNDATSAPWLATAGAGDVLAGIAAGLAARGTPLDAAAAAAAWLHARAGRLHGPALVADDLPALLPAAAREATERQPGH